jgi:hypothetical protein
MKSYVLLEKYIQTMYEKSGNKVNGYYCGPHDSLNCPDPKCAKHRKLVDKKLSKRRRRNISKKIIKED